MVEGLRSWVVVGLLIVAGTLATKWRDRTDPSKLIEVAARARTVPLTLGDWTGHETDLDFQAYRPMGIVGGCSRYYRNARTGRVVSLLIVCGESGPISVHTPEDCMVAAGFTAASIPEHVSLGPSGQRPIRLLRNAYLNQEATGTSDSEIYWCWGADRRWDVPDDPRLAYADRPYLFKVYIAHPLTGETDLSAARADVESFIGEVLASFAWPVE
jgi:hypothetical protein